MKVENKSQEGHYFGGGDQSQANMMMDISMYGNMQAHCNSANGYHHSTSSTTASDIIYSANTGNYYPGHLHHHQHHVTAAVGQPRNTPNGSSLHRSSHPHSVDVFPVNRTQAQQTQSVSPVTSATPTSSSASPSNPNVNVVVSNANATALTNQNHYSPNLYSPSAIEYGITTAGSPNGPSVEYDPYYHSPAETGGSVAAGHPDPNIISTDTGLSYTNLDYMYGNHGQAGYSLADDCSPSTPAATNTPPAAATWLAGGPNQSGNMLIHNQLQMVAHHPSPPPQHQHQIHVNSHTLHSGQHIHPHQHPGRQYHPLDGAHAGAHHTVQNSSNLAAPGSGSPIAPMHSAAQMGPLSPQQQHNLHSPANHPQSNSNQSSVQQFKWMQIKRNVPKPSGESPK